MADTMEFPRDWREFIEDYAFTDHKEFYTNGSRLVPVFRVEQMMEHYHKPVIHAQWVIETEVFKHNPDMIYVKTVCSECGARLRTERFDTNEWNDYKKDHYVIESTNYCHDCGAKMDKEGPSDV